MALPGIFCLEGEWSTNLADRAGVEPILDLLVRLGIARTIHRDVATREELDHYLGKLNEKRYDAYKVIYLAMHGDVAGLSLGKDDVSLEQLQETLEGRCAGRVVYFGSCLTLKTDDASLKTFARATGARAVVGYGKSIPWLEGAAFEVLLLDRLVSGLRSDAIFNRLANEHGSFAASLGLVVATKSAVRRSNKTEQA